MIRMASRSGMSLLNSAHARVSRRKYLQHLYKQIVPGHGAERAKACHDKPRRMRRKQLKPHGEGRTRHFAVGHSRAKRHSLTLLMHTSYDEDMFDHRLFCCYF